MVPRVISEKLQEIAKFYPVVVVTGPRQAGKTTLCRALFLNHQYVSLETLDRRRFALEDPRGFLAAHADGAILDEAQHVPDLFSYLQEEVDLRPVPGRFIVTGSQHFGLAQSISQSLAGRAGVLHLLPLSLDELRAFPKAPSSLLETLWAGAFPRVHDQGIPADRWFADYTTTYIQRDVRQVLQVGDLNQFTTFVRLAAGRTAQVLNLSALGADCGVSHNTCRSWLSVLETAFLAARLPPWHRSLNKQLVRAPKLHVLDSGLLCSLLGIRDPEHLRSHPLRGAIFESWVFSEIYKARVNRGLSPDMFFYRDHKGLEVDLVLDSGSRVTLVESKSGATVGSDFFQGLETLARRMERSGEERPAKRLVVYGGDTAQVRTDATAIPWSSIQGQSWE